MCMCGDSQCPSCGAAQGTLDDPTASRRVDILADYTGADRLPCLSTRRPLSREDLAAFCRAVRRHPGVRVRCYSGMGFLPNAYRWRADIQYIERGRDGRIHTRWTGAQRSRGIGPYITANNREIGSHDY